VGENEYSVYTLWCDCNHCDGKVDQFEMTSCEVNHKEFIKKAKKEGWQKVYIVRPSEFKPGTTFTEDYWVCSHCVAKIKELGLNAVLP